MVCTQCSGSEIYPCHSPAVRKIQDDLSASPGYVCAMNCWKFENSESYTCIYVLHVWWHCAPAHVILSRAIPRFHHWSFHMQIARTFPKFQVQSPCALPHNFKLSLEVNEDISIWMDLDCPELWISNVQIDNNIWTFEGWNEPVTWLKCLRWGSLLLPSLKTNIWTRVYPAAVRQSWSQNNNIWIGHGFAWEPALDVLQVIDSSGNDTTAILNPKKVRALISFVNWSL